MLQTFGREIQTFSQEINECRQHAASCAARAKAAAQHGACEGFERLEKSWLKLAMSYELTAQLLAYTQQAQRKHDALHNAIAVDLRVSSS